MDITDTAGTNAKRRYSRGAIVLHWLIALAIIANWILALYAEDLPKAENAQMMGIHFALGTSVLILSVLWVIWRIAHKPPPPNPDHKAWERLLSGLVHKLFYFLIIALPFTGYMAVQTYMGGMAIDMFGLFDFPGITMAKDKQANEVFYEIHEVFGILMLVLLVLHIAGALKHHFLDRDGTIARMLPFGRIRR